MSPARPRPGADVHVDFRKWDGQVHWQNDAVHLGSDQHGDWIGIREGTHFERPGAAFDIESDSVMLFADDWYVASFNDVTTPGLIEVYVDLTTVPKVDTVDGTVTFRMIDLDLDVVQRVGERAYLDDEDEFAEHREQFGYPRTVVDACERTAAELLVAVREQRGPFAPPVAQGWFDRLRGRRT